MITLPEHPQYLNTTWRQIALWIFSVAVAAIAHAGVFMWFSRQPPIEMVDNALPPAIMIELAAEPEVVHSDMNQVSEETQDSVEARSDNFPSVDQPKEALEPVTSEDIRPEEAVKETAERETLEKISPEAEFDHVEQEVIAQLENVEVPTPTARPKRVQRERLQTRPIRRQQQRIEQRPDREQSAQASRSSNRGAAQVRQSNRNAARQTTAAVGAGSISPARWQSRLMAHLERRKRYPSGARARREQGTVYVRFSIDERGNVLSVALARSSGFSELDAEVLSLVRRASPVPAPPADINKTITTPVQFTARSSW